MARITQSRLSHDRLVLFGLLILLLAFPVSHAQSNAAGCPIKIESLKDAAPFSDLSKEDQAKVLHALSDDIAEMAELDIASTDSSHAAYRTYFDRHLEFKVVSGATTAEELLLIRYHSNTMCGTDDNCPVWIVRTTHADGKTSAESMVPWQEELGTSAGGAWGVGVLPQASSRYPDLILLTHLSSTQTGLACYRKSKRNYLRVDCPPDCTRLLGHGNAEEAEGK